MQLKSNLSLASRSYTKIGKEPEKECSTGGWWRWPWPPCPAPPLFALWVRPTSSPFWQSERGSAQPQGMPLMPSCQFMIQYKSQHLGSGKTVGLWNSSPNLFLLSCLPGFNKHRLRLNLIGVRGTNCRSWSYVLERNAASLFPRSPASVWISCCPPLAWVISHTTERASCWFQQLWKTFKKLKEEADNISISLNQTNSLKQYTQLCV